jgi:hypothetical protein
LDRNSISLVSIRVVCVTRMQNFLHGSSDPPVFIGTGQSTPRIAFVKSAAERAIFDATNLHIAEDDVANTWAFASVFGKLAEDRDDGYLRHINTENTARDMLRIVEAHGRTKIQYWGFS